MKNFGQIKDQDQMASLYKRVAKHRATDEKSIAQIYVSIRSIRKWKNHVIRYAHLKRK